MMQDPFFDDKAILVVDKAPKTKNDRTWCFWENGKGLFEPLVHHRWDIMDFYSRYFSGTLDINPYQYKMIRAADLYTYVQERASRRSNIHFHYESVVAVGTAEGKGYIELLSGRFTADIVFNSILFKEPLIGDKEYMLLQHFKGWMIETPTSVFDPAHTTFMDFRIPQDKGTAFMYVLPVSDRSALVEYTLFTEKLLPEEQYETAISTYLENDLHIADYTIGHEEFGIIPMTNHVFPSHQGRVVYLGIAGGQAKGSSGYVFQFIQKRTAAIVASLAKARFPSAEHSFCEKKFRFYDSVLLNVLHHQQLNGDRIFAGIFKKNPAARVLRFLDNETNLWDDLLIMNSVPTSIFFKAAMQELLR